MSTTLATRPGQGNLVPGSPAPSAPAAPPLPRFENVDPPARPEPEPDQLLDDPDGIALANARRAVEEEDAAAALAAGTPAATTARTATAPAIPPAAPAATAPRVAPTDLTVPKARFDEALGRARAAELEVAALKGALSSHGVPLPTATGAPAPAPAPAAPDPHRNLVLAQNHVMDAAAKYEAGDIAFVDFSKALLQGMALTQDSRDAITFGKFGQEVNEAIQAAIRTQVKPGLADRAIVDQHVVELVKSMRWVGRMTPTQMQQLEVIAREEAKALGKPFGTGVEELMRLQQAVAELGEVMGPRWYPGESPPPHPSAAPAAAPAAPAARPDAVPPPGTVPTAAQRAAKVAIAATFPPNAQASGGTRTSAELTEADIEGLSHEEVEAIPPGLRRRLLGITE